MQRETAIDAPTIVVDVDDTVSTHVARDYENAVPHVAIIDKLNAMFLSGWRVVYYTARGQNSCNGDLEAIERERRPVLESWMDRHGVLRTELRFGKPLGTIYVDDRAYRPDEFMSMPVETMRGGSGAEVARLGPYVVKRGPTVADQSAWYEECRRRGFQSFRVPRVYGTVGSTLTMEYVEGSSAFDAGDSRDVRRLMDVVVEMSRSPVTNADWATMVSRVRQHLDLNRVPHQDEILRVLTSSETSRYMNCRGSFYHGDLTLSNVVVSGSEEKPVLIDPNYVEGLYGSYLLDAGKLLQSLHHGYEETFLGQKLSSSIDSAESIEYFRLILGEDAFSMALLMELVHYIRLLKYRPARQHESVRAVISKIWQEFTNDVPR